MLRTALHTHFRGRLDCGLLALLADHLRGRCDVAVWTRGL